MHTRQNKEVPYLKASRLGVLGGVIGGIALEGLALPIAIASMGAGHGSYFYVKMLFPFTMLLFALIGSIPIWAAVLSLFQFPAYGWLIGRKSKGRERLSTILAVAAVHAGAVALGFALEH